MKKKFILFLLIVITIMPFVFAAKNSPSYSVYLDGKSRADATVMFWYGNEYQVIATNLIPNEKYVLAYTEGLKTPGVICTRYDNKCQIRPGSSYSSQIGPKIKCIDTKILADEDGMTSKSGKYSYLKITEDKKDQYLMLVLASDAKCSSGRILHWNPENYLNSTTAI